MASMALKMANKVLPDSIRSTVYSVGLTGIPPPYNIMLDKVCFIYGHLENENKEKMKVKIVELINVLPIPNKGQLTEGVDMVSDICEMKGVSVNGLLKGVLNSKIDMLLGIIDHVIKLAPDLEKDPSKMVDLVVELNGKLMGLLGESVDVDNKEDKGEVNDVVEEWKNEGERHIGIMKNAIFVLKKGIENMEEIDKILEMLESVEVSMEESV